MGEDPSRSSWSMPREAHQTFFVSNAVAEALDLDKKKVEV